MRYRIGTFLIFFFVPVAYALAQQHTGAGLVPCGVVPGSVSWYAASECGLCDFVLLLNNIINFLIELAVPIAIGLFAWAGILYFTANGNPTSITRAHKVFKSVLIGIALALAAWLIVQTILTALVNPDFFTSGSWNGLTCSSQERQRTGDVKGLFGFLNKVGNGTNGGVSGGSNDNPANPLPLTDNTGACDASAISAAAAENGDTLSSQQASFLACVAKPESSCGTKISGARTADGTRSSAFGAFQVVVSTNATCVNNTTCAGAAKAAGYTVPSGGLNCATAVNQGRPAGIYANMAATDSNNLGQACIAAGSNFNCNVSAAACILQGRPNGADWSNASDGLNHNGQAACTGIL